LDIVGRLFPFDHLPSLSMSLRHHQSIPHGAVIKV
jgi:hypothetical protein